MDEDTSFEECSPTNTLGHCFCGSAPLYLIACAILGLIRPLVCSRKQQIDGPKCTITVCAEESTLYMERLTHGAFDREKGHLHVICC